MSVSIKYDHELNPVYHAQRSLLRFNLISDQNMMNPYGRVFAVEASVAECQFQNPQFQAALGTKLGKTFVAGCFTIQMDFFVSR